MTDNEIIKALECCLKGCNAEGCDDCPLYEKVEDCEIEIPIIALDLINRQKAKIERLKRYDEERDIALHARLIANAKTEAIREFVEKLKREIDMISYETGFEHQETIDTIDNLVKEMTEGGAE